MGYTKTGKFLGHWSMGVLLKIPIILPIFLLLLFFPTESFEENNEHLPKKDWFTFGQSQRSPRTWRNSRSTNLKRQKSGRQANPKWEPTKTSFPQENSSSTKRQTRGRGAKLKWKPTEARFANEDSSSMERQAREKRCDCKRKNEKRGSSRKTRMQIGGHNNKRVMRTKQKRQFSKSRIVRR